MDGFSLGLEALSVSRLLLLSFPLRAAFETLVFENLSSMRASRLRAAELIFDSFPDVDIDIAVPAELSDCASLMRGLSKIFIETISLQNACRCYVKISFFK